MGPIFLFAPLDLVTVIFADVGMGKRKCCQLKSQNIQTTNQDPASLTE
jgi:hypothetical protein